VTPHFVGQATTMPNSSTKAKYKKAKRQKRKGEKEKIVNLTSLSPFFF